MKGINIFLADGFEDVEALGTNDVLRRGGVQTRLVAISDEPFVTSSHGVMVGPDCLLSDVANEAADEETTPQDIMIFPGGMPGSKSLSECQKLMTLMREHYTTGGSLAAICAAPGLVLSKMGETLLPKGLEFTCFDGFESHLSALGAHFKPQGSVRCGRIITGRSAGHALSFGLEILSYLKGEDCAAEVRHSLYLQ